jgi:BirA family transcriptional regulator, biotin operon repressor / biotin---[acetyl-CoA-carboxylase] ligase
MNGAGPGRPAGGASPLLLGLDHFPTHASCTSTQDLCRAQALQGAPEGTAVTALEQTAGRGRGERKWYSAAGQGLWISFVLRPSVDSAEWPALTALTALALAEAVESLPGAAAAAPQSSFPSAPGPWRAAIKWPNDLRGRRGKLAGILAEAVGDAVVVGLGLNLGQAEGSFPPELYGKASSLRLEGFEPVPGPEEMARRLNDHLTRHYLRFQNGRREALAQGLKDRFFLRDSEVEVDCAGNRIRGRVSDLGPRGELILLTAEGERVIFSGEVVSYRFAGSEAS